MVSLGSRGHRCSRNRPNNLIQELVGVSQTLLVAFLESTLHSGSGQRQTDSHHLKHSPFLHNTGPEVHPKMISPRRFRRKSVRSLTAIGLLSSYEPNRRTSALESFGWILFRLPRFDSSAARIWVNRLKSSWETCRAELSIRTPC